MELNETEQKTVKRIYDFYHSNEIDADEALLKIELLINGQEICQGCFDEIDDDNPLIDPKLYTVNDETGYCDGCYYPTK